MRTLDVLFQASFDSLASIGRDAVSGGYHRLAWSQSDLQAREWFVDQADRLGLTVEVDKNGHMWAWWGSDRNGAVATGSHLDTVIDGGAFDGALGVVSSFVAVEVLQKIYELPRKPVVIVAFVEEEGARFGLPTLGSRLSMGIVEPGEILNLTDSQGVLYSDAMSLAGVEPDGLGADLDRLESLSAFVELHIEQGRGLVDHNEPVGILSNVWPHGRWRLDAAGSPDHAGAARIADRRDPTLVLARAIESARVHADSLDARATIARIELTPNTTNTIPGRATAWLDARAESEGTLGALVEIWHQDVKEAAIEHDIAIHLDQVSFTPEVTFDQSLVAVMTESLTRIGIQPTQMATAAGHDAAILASVVPSAMLHVRNPTGLSHSPAEHASLEDCRRGVEALAAVIEDLACR